MNFEAIIGLELHIEMKTKSKMFSSAPVSFGSLPNTNVGLEDIAFPGSMPLVNKQAVINAIRVANVLHMSIDNELWFDRKNYFYSDLPRGYQITQYKRPLGLNGYLDIDTPNGTKQISLERLHIEEDTCKQIHTKDKTYLDYNRSGIPLLEIVTKPDLRSGEEAMLFIEKIRSIVSFLEVSDGRMEEGSLRCDINVSIRPIGFDRFCSKAEIKNVNTLNNVKSAIDFEIKRQQRLLLIGLSVKQETRRFDELTRETISMRNKTDAIDYKYFTESNIPPIKLSKEFIKEAIDSSNELAEQKYQRYLKLSLSEYDARLLTSDKNRCDYFDETLKYCSSPKLVANWLLVDIQSILNKNNISIKDFQVSPQRLGELIVNIEKGVISNKQAREIFNVMLKDESGVAAIIKRLNITNIGDEKYLLDIIKNILNNNLQLIIDYKNGKDKAVGFVIGQVMNITQGKANPKITSELVKKELMER